MTLGGYLIDIRFVFFSTLGEGLGPRLAVYSA